jgi:hypothetical protein
VRNAIAMTVRCVNDQLLQKLAGEALAANSDARIANPS